MIGEAVLSLPPEESDRVFPDLYLPIVDECNRRTWAPWRKYMPLRETFEYNRCVKALNSYVTELIERRHRELQSRADGKGQEPERRTDILDRILAAVADQPWTPTLVRQLRDEIKVAPLRARARARVVGRGLWRTLSHTHVRADLPLRRPRDVVHDADVVAVPADAEPALPGQGARGGARRFQG